MIFCIYNAGYAAQISVVTIFDKEYSNIDYRIMLLCILGLLIITVLPLLLSLMNYLFLLLLQEKVIVGLKGIYLQVVCLLLLRVYTLLVLYL